MPDSAKRFDDFEVSGPHSGVARSPVGLLGRTIDRRYRVDALLGEGGMGLVYRVTHTDLNKTLAIKVLRRENTRDEEVLARFRREAESASAIGNEHIVDINDFGTLEDGSTYFVMECLEGMDLIEAMDRSQRMPEDRAVRIAMQLCRALNAAHGAGIVHRDLKPENVFLTERRGSDDFVKVLDFGIAKVANGPKRLTRAGEVLGTPHYMSPEQCEGEDVDHRTDIYALGVLLYEMVTGRVPHDADTMMGILTKHMYEEPIPPKVRAPQVSESLEEVIMRCLAKRPERRYQTMHEIEADLGRIQQGKRPVGPDTVTLTTTRPPQPKRRELSPMVLGGLGVTLIALLGMLAMTLIPDRGAEPVQTTLVATQPAAPQPDRVAATPEAPPEPSPARAKRARTKPSKRETKARDTRPAEDGHVILDPWK